MRAILVLSVSAFCLSLAARASGPSVVRLSLQTEPSQLDSSRANQVTDHFVLGHVLEGLVRYGKNGDFVPGVAESWKISGESAIFKLRKHARWSDGVPVKAADFVYGWTRVVDPANASPYAFILYAVKNAEAIAQGRKPASELGVS